MSVVVLKIDFYVTNKKSNIGKRKSRNKVIRIELNSIKISQFNDYLIEF